MTGLEVVGPARVAWGTIDPLGGPPPERTLWLRNAGKTPRTLVRIDASCGCTTVLRATRPDGTLVLPPGAKTPLRLRLDPRRLEPGAFSKSVAVFEEGASAPTLTLTLEGRVLAVVAFEPPALAFGAGEWGSVRERALRLTADKRLPASIRLVSSNPDVAPVWDRESRQVRVTLAAQARLGPVTGYLCLVDGAAPSVFPPDAEDVALFGQAAPLSGSVSGSIEARPRTLVLGSVPVGRSKTLPVALVERRAGALEGLTIESVGASLTARREGATLWVTLEPDAPVGGARREVVVRTAAGERLAIPVYLTVLATR